jgi:hypothetical protein
MDPLVIALIVIGVLVLVVFVGGVLAAQRRDRQQAPTIEDHIAAADRALEEARATDKGWDRDVLEQVARAAVDRERPEFGYDSFELVLVDDKPGVHQDRAHFLATGRDGELRVVLARHDGDWTAERVH